MPIDVGFICRTCKGCRAHSRDTKTIPVVPRLALVSYISVPSIMVRLEKYLKAPQSIISLSFIFTTALATGQAVVNTHCTTIKFILGGRFKETKLFSEQKKRIGVFYLKSCRPSIFSLICERESDQNNRITGKITKISAGICRK